MGLNPGYILKSFLYFFVPIFFRHVDEILRQRIPGSFVRSYGSSMTGIGLKSSGLNLDFQIPPETAPHEALIKAFQTLTLKTDEFSNVNPDFTAKIPVVSFNVGGKKTIFKVIGFKILGTYSSNKIRKTQNDHLTIVCQNLNCL